jgi:hypothetical protein
MRYAPVLALALAACTPSAPSEPSGGRSPHSIVTGHLERQSDGIAWLGTEQADVYDGDGHLVCQGEWQLDAEQVGPESGCDGCTLTLDLDRRVTTSIAADCPITIDQDALVAPAGLVAFVGDLARDRSTEGTVVVARGQEWVTYASGVLVMGDLDYIRSPSASGDEWLDLRNLGLPPIDRY